MRSDYRGMGDSEGDPREFASTDDDIRAAVDCFFDEIPELQEVVLWGLCDAASAAVFYAPNDRRVAGLVLLNPWVRSEQGIAKAYLKHYYLARLLDPQLWRKIFTGKFAFFSALHSLAQQISRLVFKPKGAQTNTDNGPLNQGVTHLPKKFEEDLRRFKGRSLFILCDNDLTAQEFSDLSQSSDGWKKLMASSQVSKRNVEGANHTFSQRDWREKIGQWTIDWVKED
jgi:exosortase A-associated hydrolase 1